MPGTSATRNEFRSPRRLIPNGATGRNFFRRREEVIKFLERKWAKELDYRLVKELWGFRDNRMAERFEYEWRNVSGNWFRSYGNELWEFDAEGLTRKRYASINDLAIKESDGRLNSAGAKIV